MPAYVTLDDGQSTRVAANALARAPSSRESTHVTSWARASHSSSIRRASSRQAQQTWQAVACTGAYYPDKTPLTPGAHWRPDGWPFQDDDGAGCYLATVDNAGHLGDGVCLSVPQNGQKVFHMSEARPLSLAECMDRSNPSI